MLQKHLHIVARNVAFKICMAKINLNYTKLKFCLQRNLCDLSWNKINNLLLIKKST